MIESFLFSDEESTVLLYLVANKAFPRLFEELNKAARKKINTVLTETRTYSQEEKGEEKVSSELNTVVTKYLEKHTD